MNYHWGIFTCIRPSQISFQWVWCYLLLPLEIYFSSWWQKGTHVDLVGLVQDSGLAYPIPLWHFFPYQRSLGCLSLWAHGRLWFFLLQYIAECATFSLRDCWIPYAPKYYFLCYSSQLLYDQPGSSEFLCGDKNNKHNFNFLIKEIISRYSYIPSCIPLQLVLLGKGHFNGPRPLLQIGTE